jgi:hypothetical protein
MQHEKQEKRRPKKRGWIRFIPQLVLGLGGLAAYFSWQDSHRKLTRQELDTALTRYMQGKYAIYKDTLTPVGKGKVQWYPSDILYPTPGIYEIEFESKKYPKKWRREKLVLYYDYEIETLRDNYMDFVLREQIENKFREIFGQIYETNSYELMVSIPRYPEVQYDHNATENIDEYLRNATESTIRVCVARGLENEVDDMSKLLGILKDRRYGIDAQIYYLTHDQFDAEERRERWRKKEDFKHELYIHANWWRGDKEYQNYLREPRK